MNDYLMQRRLSMPISGPGVTPAGPAAPHSAPQKPPAQDFSRILDEQLAKAQEVTFSRHAAERAVERGIELTEQSLQKLGEAVRIARGKGLDDTLVLMEQAAFIVSAQNARVITALSDSELSGSVITNIQGAVIL